MAGKKVTVKGGMAKAEGIISDTGKTTLYNNTLSPIVIYHNPHNAGIINPTKLARPGGQGGVITVPARGSTLIEPEAWNNVKSQPAVKKLLDMKALRVDAKKEPVEAMERVSAPKASGELTKRTETSGTSVGTVKSQVVEQSIDVPAPPMKEIDGK